MTLAMSYKEFSESIRKPEDSWWCRNVLRKISMRASWIIVRKAPKVTANQLTAIAGCIGFAGAVVLMIPGSVYPVIASLILLFWTVLDAVDGEVARYKDESSLVGSYLDNVFDHLILATVFLSLTIRLLVGDGSEVLVMLGFLATAFFLMSRLAIGLRAENLVKRDIGVSRLGGMPKDELRISENHASKSVRFGVKLVKVYGWMITNYNIVHIVFLCAFLNYFGLVLEIMGSEVPLLAVPALLYVSMVPFFVVVVVGFYVQLRNLERNANGGPHQ